MEDILHSLELEVHKNKRRLTQKHALVSKLLTQCQSDTLSQVKNTSVLLLHATGKNLIDVSSLIAEIQVTIATSKFPHILIELLCELLRVQHESGHTVVYSLRGNTHPLVSLVSNRPDTVNTCIHMAIQLIRNYPQPSTLHIIEPFIKYLLLQPVTANISQSDILHQQLLEVATDLPTISQCVINLLMKLASFYQCNSVNNLLSTVYRINGLCRAVSNVCLEKHLYQLTQHCLSVCVECTIKGLPISNICQCLNDLILTTGSATPQLIMCIGWLIIKHMIDAKTIHYLLKLARMITQFKTIGCLILLKLPLIYLVSQSTYTYSSIWKTNREISYDLLEVVNQTGTKFSVATISAPYLSTHYSILCETTQQYCLYIQNRQTKWLETVLSTLQQDKPSSRCLLHLAIAVCAVEDFTTAFNIYSILPKHDPNVAPILVSLTLYSLSHSSDPFLQLKLLQSLQYYCCNSYITSLVTKVISTLTRQPTLQPIALRLLTQLWIQHDAVFPHICSILSSPPTISNSLRREWALAAASTLKDICTLRPENHGEEALRYISQVLNVSDEPVVLCLLINAMVGLCSVHVVEVSLLWKLLASKLIPGRNPGVDIALCELFGLASQLECSQPSEKIFKENALKYLWMLTTLSDQDVISSAVKSLSHFKVDDHLPSLLPQILLNQLSLESHPLDVPLTPSHILSLILLIPHNIKDAIIDFVESVLRYELEDMSRGIQYEVMQRTSTNSSLDRCVQEIWSLFKRNLSLNEPTAVLNILTVSHSIPSSQSSLAHLVELFGKATKTNSIPVEGQELDFTTGISIGSIWVQFMNILLRCQAEVLHGKIPEQQEKRCSVITRAVEELYQKLKEMARSPVFNLIGALVGLCCSELKFGGKVENLQTMLAFLDCQLCGKPLLTEGSLSKIMKVIISVNKPEDILQSSLLLLPTLLHSLLEHPVVLLQCNELIGQLTSDLINSLKSSHSSLRPLLNYALSYVLQHLSFLDTVRSISHQFCYNFPERTLEPNESSMLALMCSHDTTRDKAISSLNLFIELIQKDGLSQCDLEIMCYSIATSLPVFVYNGAISHNDMMRVIQSVATAATKYNMSPSVHWSLGASLFGVYRVGMLSVTGLMENLAERWIQEIQIALERDYTQILSPLMGVTGLIGLLPVVETLHGCTPTALLNSVLPLISIIFQRCLKVEDPGFRNHIQMILGQLCISLQFIENVEKAPRDLSYLSPTDALPTLYSHIQLFNNRSTGIAEGHIDGVIEALVKLDMNLPPAEWSEILIPLMNRGSCQNSVVSLVIEQAQKAIGFKSLISFCICNMTIQSMEVNSQLDFLQGLHMLLDVLTPSCITSILLSYITTLHIQSIEISMALINTLHKLVTTEDTSVPLSAILIELCEKVAHFIEHPDESLAFLQPSSEFLPCLSICITSMNITSKAMLQHLTICCNVLNGSMSCQNLSPILAQCLNYKLPPLEEMWFYHTIENLCCDSAKNCSYQQLLLLTLLADWSLTNEPSVVQLRLLLLIVSKILGNPQAIDEPTSQVNFARLANKLENSVKQKLCEVVLPWLHIPNEEFHSSICGLLCALKYHQCYEKTVIWTTIAHFM